MNRPEIQQRTVNDLSKRETIISASILSADFADLGRDCRRAAESGCDWLHFDVMDGMFVPSISFGEPVLKSVSAVTDIPLDVHMMVTEPARYIKRYAGCGVHCITVHYEACADVTSTLTQLRSLGVRVGLSIKPATPVSAIVQYLTMVDMVLVMTVEPGFGGQAFMPETLPKIRELRRISDQQGLDLDIQVDGGINGETAPLVREAGANVLVSGSYLFAAKDMRAAAASLR